LLVDLADARFDCAACDPAITQAHALSKALSASNKKRSEINPKSDKVGLAA
jgi:hypothetical protein